MARKEKKQKSAKPEKKDGRLRQIRRVYTITRKSDRWIGFILLGVFLLVGALVFAALAFFVPGGWGFMVVPSIMMGLLAALIVNVSSPDGTASYEELKARGVEFTDSPEERPYGIDSGFRDPSGNSIRLTEVMLPANA